MTQSEATSDRVYPRRMTGKPPALSLEERSKLSEVVTALIAEHGSASKLSEVMTAAGHRVSQPTLSKAARGDDAGGYHLARTVALFLKLDVEEVLGIVTKRGPRWRARGTRSGGSYGRSSTARCAGNSRPRRKVLEKFTGRLLR